MRTKLSLYALDRPALVELSGELRKLLAADDRAGLARLLELGGALAERLASGPRAVDWFLRPESDPEAAPIFASLRRVAKKRALSHAFTSEEPSLEGRLRHHEILREDPRVADLVDKLLSPRRLPWFLCRPGATGGWLDGAKREALANALRSLRAALPPEVNELGRALDDLDGDVVAHDGL